LASEKALIATQEGSGGLSTLRIEWDLSGTLQDSQSSGHLEFENKNFAGRLGWNEMIAASSGGIKIYNSSVFGSGVSNELKAYPQESLNAPLHERTADLSFTAGALPENANSLVDRSGQVTASAQKDKFAELIAVREITPAIILFSLLIAFGLGALHAMSPGHGKTVVGAYLVGSRGTVKHAIFLGLTVTITHTLGVFALGLITLFASQYILPERIMPFLNFVSGLLVFFIGITLFKDRLFSFFGWPAKAHGHSHGPDGHTHEDGHSADHVHDPGDPFSHTHDGITHSHLPPTDITWRSLLALGISGGLLPCPSALVLMLSAISLGRIGYGLILTLVFSFGLAATLTVVGLMFLFAGKAIGNSALSQSRIFKVLPTFSALVIACAGAVICYSSLR
jgi:nickel/cobalt transporter (NicO) family protein